MRIIRNLLLPAGATVLLTVASVDEGQAQAGRDGDGWRWRPRWRLSLQSTYDDNPFGLSPRQMTRLEAGDRRYSGLRSPRDLGQTIEMRGEVRGRGLADRRIRLGSELAFDAFLLNPRRSGARLDAFVAQDLSGKARLSASVSYAPDQFRRSRLVGEERDSLLYSPGEGRDLSARLEYERELLRGRRGGPRLSTTLALRGGRRTDEAVPWLDRGTAGGEVAADLALANRFGVELGAARERSTHPPRPEPRYDRSADRVVWKVRARDFDETALKLRARVRLAGKRELALRFDRRSRGYLDATGGALGRDAVRRRFGGELDLASSRRLSVALGATRLDETIVRRTRRGDSADRDHTRSTIYLLLRIDR